MSHVSKYRISNDQVDQLSQRLARAIFLLKNQRDLQSFFNDLLSTTEKIMLGKRLLIATMIEQDFSYSDIRRRLKVTDSTIAAISERLKTGGGGLRAAVKKLQSDESIHAALERLFGPVKQAIRHMPKIAYIPHKKPSL